MAPNYVKLLMDNFEQNLLQDYFEKSGFPPLKWYHFIDNMFFIWTGNNNLLDQLVKFHLSPNEVHFGDVTVCLKYKKLRTPLFTKPPDSHFYLNTSSYHPFHVLKIILKS